MVDVEVVVGVVAVVDAVPFGFASTLICTFGAAFACKALAPLKLYRHQVLTVAG